MIEINLIRIQISIFRYKKYIQSDYENLTPNAIKATGDLSGQLTFLNSQQVQMCVTANKCAIANKCASNECQNI